MSKSDNRRNFETWFGSKLNMLMLDHDAGFIVLMVTFPLLERYVRQKSGGSEPNTDSFNHALLNIFRELDNTKNANRFWAMYRHGLLHNVTLSKEGHGLSGHKPIFEFLSDGTVWMNPNLFAERVLATIRSDFTTFEQGVALPQVFPLPQQSTTPSTSSLYLGTGIPSGGNPRQKN